MVLMCWTSPGPCWFRLPRSTVRFLAALLKEFARFLPAVMTPWRDGMSDGFTESRVQLEKNAVIDFCSPVPPASLNDAWICCMGPRKAFDPDCCCVSL